ncbi:MAG: glycosyltransferase family 9 protein [Pseudomonadota bacterium]
MTESDRSAIVDPRLPLPSEVTRILVIALPNIGDVLLCTPLLSALKVRYGAEIDVLLRPGQGGILAGNPDVNQVLEIEGHPSFGDYVVQARQLWRRYQLVVSNSLSTRAALYGWVAAPIRVSVAGAPGMRHQEAKRFHTVSVDFDYGWHTLTLMRKLGEALGLGVQGPVRLPGSPDAVEQVDSALASDLRTSTGAEPPLAVLHANPGLPVKRWVPAHWATLANALAAQGYRVLATGGPGQAEYDYVQTCFEGSPALNLCGALSLAGLAELLRRTSLYVGVDTLASHMAAALDRPGVALFGPGNPVIWGPWPQAQAAPIDSPWTGFGDGQVGNFALIQPRRPGSAPHRQTGPHDVDDAAEPVANIAPDDVLAAVRRVTDRTSA